MNKKLFYISVFLIFALLMVGCGGVTPSTSTGITGNWTMTNLVESTNNPVHSVGATTTAKCYISDSSGSLTISNFRIVNQEGINWSTGYGTFSKPTISANVNGSYLNAYGQTVTTIIYFEGTIGSSGISGTGTWVQTISVAGYTWTTSGSTIFVKG
jgi:hypothetical protein